MGAKISGESGMSNGMSVILINYKLKNFTGEKWGRHYLNQAIKVTMGTRSSEDKVSSGAA